MSDILSQKIAVWSETVNPPPPDHFVPDSEIVSAAREMLPTILVLQDEITRLREMLNSHEKVTKAISAGVNADLQADRAFAVALLRKAQEEIAQLKKDQDGEITRLRAERAWRPINTAPLDGTEVLLLIGPAEYQEVRFGWFSQYRKQWHYFEMGCGSEDNIDYCREGRALAWMPLPKPTEASP